MIVFVRISSQNHKTCIQTKACIQCADEGIVATVSSGK